MRECVDERRRSEKERDSVNVAMKVDRMNSVTSRMMPLDYGLSYIHSAEFNSVRFLVESRTRLMDERSGRWIDYHQCASCKSENTFAERDLFRKDNYDFLPIFGEGYVLIFRRPAGLSDRYRQVCRYEDLWGQPILKLREARGARILDAWQAVLDATSDGLPIVAQTEVWDAQTRLRAIMEYPVKTMNISRGRRMYQVDTGPVALPDLTKRYQRQIECLSLAYVAFNAPTFSDFVVEQPTPVTGTEGCRVYHYSNPFSLRAENRLFALDRPGD